MSADPVASNPDLYSVMFENDRVRVLEDRDRPGTASKPHMHPDSVMITLSAFRRRLASGGHQVEVELPAGDVRWLPAQRHSGENIGDTETHRIFVELKEPALALTDEGEYLGPTPGSPAATVHPTQ